MGYRQNLDQDAINEYVQFYNPSINNTLENMVGGTAEHKAGLYLHSSRTLKKIWGDVSKPEGFVDKDFIPLPVAASDLTKDECKESGIKQRNNAEILKGMNKSKASDLNPRKITQKVLKVGLELYGLNMESFLGAQVLNLIMM